jgi:hypothetical protein
MGGNGGDGTALPSEESLFQSLADSCGGGTNQYSILSGGIKWRSIPVTYAIDLAGGAGGAGGRSIGGESGEGGRGGDADITCIIDDSFRSRHTIMMITKAGSGLGITNGMIGMMGPMMPMP